jgi:parallel beta-helix repeat protein
VSLSGLTLTGGNANGLGDNRSGGAIFSREVLALADSVLTGNEALATGGALTVASLAGGNIAVSNVVFSQNTAGQLGGGAYLAALNGGTTTITNSSFVNNQATSRGGGLFFGVGSGGIGRVESSRFLDNTGNLFGGGVELNAVNGVIDFERNYVAGNNANNFGGGIQVGIGSGHTVRIRQSTVFDNDASLAGGGIAINANTAGTLLIENSTVSGNRAIGNGGGIWFAPSNGTNEIRHSTVTGNTATVGGANQPGRGGGIYSRATLVKLDHAIVAGNTDAAASPGPDIAIDPTVAVGVAAALDARFTLVGTSAGTALAEAPLGAPDAKGNLVGGPTHGVINPLLGTLANNGSTQVAAGQTIPTHAPLPGSPVIDAGDPSAAAGAGAIPARDQRGAPHTRVFNGDGAGGARIDIGAVERQVVPNVAFGDYNQDNSVDAADYTLWRDRLGQSGLAPYSFADGDGDGTIDADDYQVWRANFGRQLAAGSGAVVAADALNELDKAIASESPAEPSLAPLRRNRVVSSPPIEAPRPVAKSKFNETRVDRHAARIADAGLLAWLSTRGNRQPEQTPPGDTLADVCEPAVNSRPDNLTTLALLTISR